MYKLCFVSVFVLCYLFLILHLHTHCNPSLTMRQYTMYTEYNMYTVMYTNTIHYGIEVVLSGTTNVIEKNICDDDGEFNRDYMRQVSASMGSLRLWTCFRR